MNMILQELDAIKLSKLISQQLDPVTCIECCKYYSAPTTALCGHTLCRTCWIGRRTCASCGAHNDKKSLKLNVPLQNLTKYVQNLRETFEELFNINLDEFILENQGDKDLEENSNKKIEEWLTSSQNHFSVPPSTQDSSIHVEHVTSHVQVHTEAKKAPVPMEIEYAPQMQHDWDKIEEMPDENNFKSNKENVVGPMDIEPFDFLKDDEYSTDKPRRSIRNKENSKVNITNISNEIVSNVNCHSSSSMETNKKSSKSVKSWNNVKKMKKEFSKLNRQNKNKLNVSIEMCKKKPVSANNIVETNVSQPYSIDDKTPEVATNNKNYCDLQALRKTNADKEIKSKNNESDLSKKTRSIDVSHSNKTNEKVVHSPDVNENREKCDDIENKVTFFKKGPLSRIDNYNVQSNVNDEQNCSNINTEDIEITIKVGSTIANIYIKKKDKDVQFNVKCDREIQTSSKDLIDQAKEKQIDIQNGEKITQNENFNIQVKNIQLTQSTVTKSNQNKFEDKSESTKKNTASADTATAHEITASIEKELLQTIAKFDSQNKQSNQSVQSASQALREIEQNVAELNDLDIFDSESVKEGHVQSLKHIKNTGSAILMPTCKSNVGKERISEKRNRDEYDDVEIPLTKKTKAANKTNNLEVTKDNSMSDSIQKPNNLECSELGNYNEIMSQVFANIDADMVDMKKSTLNLTNTADTTDKRFIRKEIVKASQKCSENVFSLVEKDAEGFETDGKKHDLPGETQKSKYADEQVENAVLSSQKFPRDDSDIIVQSTPLQEDAFSDHSVVEETPQKSASITKLKNKSDPTRSNSKLSICRVNSLDPMESKGKIVEHDSNIITLSDTLVDAPKNIFIPDKTRGRGTLETPVTINKFVDHIKYNSTPVAKKSLDFNVENVEDQEQTFCSSFVAAKTTQEKEFMCKAFEQSCSPSVTLLPRRVSPEDVKYCIAGSCLTSQQQANLKKLCAQKNWTFTDKYTKDLTHLVVGVDEENKSQRSVKFMCALAASKWIVSYDWVAKCLQSARVPPEEPFEALDGTGSPGPRRSRTARRKLFAGITFYCLPPFSVLDEQTLKEMLTAAGGRVEEQPVPAGPAPALLLAEPEHTQEDRFLYLAMERSVVPVNYEWALNCLGSYSLSSVLELLLCPAALLPPPTASWPPELVARDSSSP